MRYIIKSTRNMDVAYSVQKEKERRKLSNVHPLLSTKKVLQLHNGESFVQSLNIGISSRPPERGVRDVKMRRSLCKTGWDRDRKVLIVGHRWMRFGCKRTVVENSTHLLGWRQAAWNISTGFNTDGDSNCPRTYDAVRLDDLNRQFLARVDLFACLWIPDFDALSKRHDGEGEDENDIEESDRHHHSRRLNCFSSCRQPKQLYT